MIGAIAGDVIGSVHEYRGTKTTEFELLEADCHFTDDTVLTVAVAHALLTGEPYVDTFHEYVHAYPHAGYGSRFFGWAMELRREPYGSWGNGSAMRVSPVAWACGSLDEVLREARRSAEPTHDHEMGILGAQATAAAIFLARSGNDKGSILATLKSLFPCYDLDRRLDEIRPAYTFDESCFGTVPEAIIAFLESEDYEDAVRKAISLGGDADTLACITGGIAEAFYGGVPAAIAAPVLARLDGRLRATVEEFRRRYGPKEETQ